MKQYKVKITDGKFEANLLLEERLNDKGEKYAHMIFLDKNNEPSDQLHIILINHEIVGFEDFDEKYISYMTKLCGEDGSDNFNADPLIFENGKYREVDINGYIVHNIK